MKVKQTIYYQGRRIRVEWAGEADAPHDNWYDTVFIDAQGRYFLRREYLEYLDVSGSLVGSRPLRTKNYRSYVHQISLAAAILWAMRCSGCSAHLRVAASEHLRDSLGVKKHLRRRFERLARAFATEPGELARLIVESYTLDLGVGHPTVYSARSDEAVQARFAAAAKAEPKLDAYVREVAA